MPLIQSPKKSALKKNIETEMKANPSMKDHKQNLAIAFNVQRKNKRKKMAKGGEVKGEKVTGQEDDNQPNIHPGYSNRYAEGGKVKKGGDEADTSTTGNKTKTGGSNPGGASTGGAGTVTITTGKMAPKSISVSGVGGKTDARNAGGMDPSDEDDKDTMDKHLARGGEVHPETQEEADDEAHLMDSSSPGPYGKQPKGSYDEMEAPHSSGNPDEVHPHTGENEQSMRERHSMEMAELHLAQGGMVSDMKENYNERGDMANNDGESMDEHPDNIVEKILSKRRYAAGGKVEDSDEEGPGEQRGFNIGAKSFKNSEQSGEKDFDYSKDGEDGDEREDESENEDDEALINAIRKRMKA